MIVARPQGIAVDGLIGGRQNGIADVQRAVCICSSECIDQVIDCATISRFTPNDFQF